MKGKVSERLYKDANIERTKNRNSRFDQIRRARERAQDDANLEEEIQEFEKLEEEFEELDYLKFYPKQQRTAILTSLTAPPPDPLPPLDVTTISYYRRLSRPVFQTHLPGTPDLDPHLTHESLHLLSMLPDTAYPNFKGLKLEFERDLRVYLSAKSKDIRTMAVIASGNRILGREQDVVWMVENDEEALWVLFNHVISEKASYQALLPYVLKVNPIAFRAFYELSNVNGQESIAWFFENEEVVAALMKGLESPDPEVRNLTLRIFGNVLGEDQEIYVDTLINSPFLERIFRFLISSQAIDRKDGCWVLANFCSSERGAVAVIRTPLITEKLEEMLYYENHLEVRREMAFIFSYLIGQSDKPAIFQFAARKDFLEVMMNYLSQGDTDLSIAVLNIIRGLIDLGSEFKDEDNVNVVALTITNMKELMNEIQTAQEHENPQISESAYSILRTLGPSEQKMVGEL